MVVIEIITPECEEGSAFIYECERHELGTVLAGLLIVYPNFTDISVFPAGED